VNNAVTPNTLTLEREILFSLVAAGTSDVARNWILSVGGFSSLPGREVAPVGFCVPPVTLTGFDGEDRLQVEDDWKGLAMYRPRTKLGERLWDIRTRIVASGVPLLDWDDLEREVHERRGEVRDA